MRSKRIEVLKYCAGGVVIATWALSTAFSHQAPAKVDFRRDVRPLIPVETVRTLIDRGANVNSTSPAGKTALDFAKLRGSTAVDLLIKASAKEGSGSAALLPDPRPAVSIRAALERSIPLLQKADSIFIKQSGCVSCHNNSLTAITVATARKS